MNCIVLFVIEGFLLMRLSNYFLPLFKENPKESEITSHRLMLRSGMIYQETSGIYSWLPLGKRVLDKVCHIIREEQNKIGAFEILMPTIQSANIWRESGRYEDYGKEMLRISDRKSNEMLYGPTNEEMITDIFRSYVHSYKELPLNFYQIQWKFRDEIRPRFGVMRAREFLMKDAYSFDLDEVSSKLSYNRMFVSYLCIFSRVGLKVIPMRSHPGPIGGEISHEFVVLSDTGESTVFYDRQYENFLFSNFNLDFTNNKYIQDIVKLWTSHYAATEETHNVNDNNWKSISDNNQMVSRGIEVGHIFSFGKKYSKPMGATIIGPKGDKIPVSMGSYGIGPGRLIAAIIEKYHDDYGIIWPKSISPFSLGIINIKPGNKLCDNFSDLCYEKLQKAGFDCLLNDIIEYPGSKFATMDLIGLPTQIIIGPKLSYNGEIEIKDRKTREYKILSLDSAINYLIRNRCE